MAYRPFNRAFGETSLELKCLFFFGLALLLVITVSLFLYWHVTKSVVLEQNPNTGKLMANRAMLIKHWQQLETSKDFAPLVDRLIGNPIAESETPEEEEPQPEAEPPEDLPAEEIDAIERDRDSAQDKRDWYFITQKPLDLDNPGVGPPQNQFEAEVFDYFLKTGPGEGGERSKGRYVAGGDLYEYYQPIWAENSCLFVCHNLIPGPGFDASGTGIGPPSAGGGGRLAEGDLMAVVKVTIPYGPTRDAISRYWALLLAVSIITAFLAMIAFYVTIRYVIVRPLRHLRQVSDAISHGEIAMRAEIRTGDEFETLGVAFNRMLGHLVTVQDELRQVNVNLDVKVDELAQLNMQLYETNRIKSDFLATMSHELRTPLNSILGFSDVLGSIDSLDAKQKRYVDNIRKSGRMLLEMINSILDLAKIESGRMEVRPTEFGIAAVVGAQCDMARPLTEKRNIDLVADVPRDLPPMHQDQARVQQILNNLLSNAIKFTPEGGRIRVSAERSESGDLVMQVADTGVGIAKEDQQTIFEKFRQGKTAMPGGDAITREYSGTGLGLSIVKELCKLLDGEVWLESELGVGSTFTVRLPWDLRARPRPDRAMTAGLEEFGKLRIDVARERAPEPLSVRLSGDTSEEDGQ